MSLGKKIRMLRERSGMSQADLGKLLGITDKAVSTWENDKKIPRMGKIEKMCSIFGIRKSDLLEDDVEITMPSNAIPIGEMKKIPLLGQIACGKPILAQENITDYIDLPSHIHADFALICKGDSMIGAGIQDGDIVYIRKQDVVENGEIAAVIVNEESEATLKRFYRVGDMVTLNAENSQYAPFVFRDEEINQLHIAGKAIAYTHVL